MKSSHSLGVAQLSSETRRVTAAPLKIFAIDPGSRKVGFGLLTVPRHKLLSARAYRVHEAGLIEARAEVEIWERIGLIHQAAFELISEFKPDICVLESAFMGQFAASALKLGQARGALIVAATRAKVKVGEISPAKVKELVAGHGRASKSEVSLAVKEWTGFDGGTHPYDVTDAIAIGLAFGVLHASHGVAAPSLQNHERR
ncbi:MAG: crossover junction endodeoxyribonuclease RuvC [Zetaproteobacteria bacterium]|nr:crossover junction endodeoxyribonuclease RuvC [Zetaproteobacteria bacterium]